MKRFLTLLAALFCISISVAQESVKPTFGVELERNVSVAEINGETFYDVTVEIKAAELIGFWEGVKITVRDKNNNKLYKKHFRKSYLYAYSDGTIYIGKGNALTNMKLIQDNYTTNWFMQLKEKGIY